MKTNETKRHQKTVGDILSDLRVERGLTQVQLGKRISTSGTVIGHYESGRRYPTGEHLINLADFFGVSTDFILGRTDVRKLDTDLQSVCDYTGLSENTIGMIHKDSPELTIDGITEDDYTMQSIEIGLIKNRRILINTLFQFVDIDSLCSEFNRCCFLLSAKHAKPQPCPDGVSSSFWESNLWGKLPKSLTLALHQDADVAAFKCNKLFLHFLESLDEEE